MKIKLNQTQQQKLAQSISKENGYREQFQTARNLYVEAMQSRISAVELICDAHGIDAKNFDLNSLKITNGELELTEVKAPGKGKLSEQIKKTLNKAGKK